MERIKKALEQAKNERGGIKPTTARRKNKEAPPLEQEIKYSETRVANIDKHILEENKILVEPENTGAMSALKILRTHVEQRLAQNNWNTLAITSPVAGQGKTTTAINLAINLARELHRTVLLVDLDLRNPTIHRRLGIEADKGILDYLTLDTPVSEILCHPSIERCVVLPSVQAVTNSAELLGSPRMAALVEELRTRYESRIVIFDLPPLLSTDDAMAFIPQVDSTLLVVEDGKTTKDNLQRCVELLDEHNLLGTVLNRTLEKQPTYY